MCFVMCMCISRTAAAINFIVAAPVLLLPVLLLLLPILLLPILLLLPPILLPSVLLLLLLILLLQFYCYCCQFCCHLSILFNSYLEAINYIFYFNCIISSNHCKLYLHSYITVTIICCFTSHNHCTLHLYIVRTLCQ